MSRIDFLGCPVDNLTMAAVVQRVCELVEDGDSHVIAVVNANKLWQMGRDAKLQQIVSTADLIVPEYAVEWGAALLGNPFPEHIGGLTLLLALLPAMAERGYRPFFLGAREEVVASLVVRLQGLCPGLSIAGYHHGYFGSDESAVIEAIRRVRPDVLFLGLGSPKQEYWMSANRERLGVPVCMGVGGSFDVLAGLKKDAPGWARARGLEWLYRLAQDPRAYWKRYLVTNSWFVWQVFKAKAGFGAHSAGRA